jgi:hypothetical protein
MPVILKRNIPDFYFAAFAAPSETLDPLQTAPSKILWINAKRLKPTWKQLPLENLLDLLKNPDPSDSNAGLVAERLSLITADYLSIIKKIAEALPIEREELFGLSFLVLTLLAEAESPSYRNADTKIDADEFTWDKFESAVSGAEIQAKRTRRSLAITDGDLLDHGMHFILNRSGNPFITSDRALFVDSWTPQEAQRIFGPLGILDTEVSGGTERVIVLPISPELALVSSAFIQRDYQNAPYLECASEETVFALNLLVSYGAERIIISNENKPFGQSEDKVRDLMSKNLTG